MEIRLRLGVHKNKVQVYAIGEDSSKYKSVSVLLGKGKALKTDAKFWIKSEQRFQHNIVGASEDNKLLRGLKEKLEDFASSREFDSPEDFFKSYEKEYLEVSAHVDKSVSLLEYAKTFRDMWKDGKVEGYENKSTNYRIYDKFINKLEGKVNREVMPWAKEARKFANMPIASIEAKDLEAWAKFLKVHGLGYKESINAFRRTVYFYRRQVMKDNTFKFNSLGDLAPKSKTVVNRKDFTFTERDVEIIKTCDLSDLKFEVKTLRTREMLRDVAVLVYGLCSRPCDVITMRIEDLKYDKAKDIWYWGHCPEKLKNMKYEDYKVPIASSFADIIVKHKGDRKKGFVFQFACNKTTDWQKKENGVNHVDTKAGSLLKAIAKTHRLSITNPTLYNMRKTGITMLCSKSKMSTDNVAILARTSRREVESVYRDKSMVAQRLDVEGML